MKGPAGPAYPWGDTMDPALVPEFTSGRELPPPDEVTAHPGGASWAGLQDLLGNVYQWTSVFSDSHTSRAVLRGSPHWRPAGSKWYQGSYCIVDIATLMSFQTVFYMHLTKQASCKNVISVAYSPTLAWRRTGSGLQGRCMSTTPFSLCLTASTGPAKSASDVSRIFCSKSFITMIAIKKWKSTNYG